MCCVTCPRVGMCVCCVTCPRVGMCVCCVTCPRVGMCCVTCPRVCLSICLPVGSTTHHTRLAVHVWISSQHLGAAGAGRLALALAMA